MKTFDIKSDMPDTIEAGRRLAEIMKTSKGHFKAIKIIHGYGSSGVGGKIKITVRKSLKKRVANNEIKAYIPGEAIGSLMGFVDEIYKYKNLIKDDESYKKCNDGITYVIL